MEKRMGQSPDFTSLKLNSIIANLKCSQEYLRFLFYASENHKRMDLKEIYKNKGFM